MSCDSGHCITCSDEALPMQVMRPDQSGVALCTDESGATSEVSAASAHSVAASATRGEAATRSW